MHRVPCPPDEQCVRTFLNGRPVWLFADGTVLPVVSGGSDAGLPPDAEVAAPTDDAAEPEADAPEEMTDDQLEEAFTRLESDRSTTPQSLAEVKKLRAQVAKRREASQQYAFLDTFHPDDRSMVLETMQALVDNPQAATVNMAQMLQSMWGDQLGEVLQQLGLTERQADKVVAKADAPTDDAEDEGPDLTDPAAMQRYIREQAQATAKELAAEQKREQDIATEEAKIYSTLRELGLPDPRSEDAQMVLLAAQRFYNLDLRKAHEELRKKGYKLGTQPAPAGAEAPQAPAALKGEEAAQESGNGRETRDEMMRRIQRDLTARLDSAGVPAS